MKSIPGKRWEWLPTVVGVIASIGIGVFFYFRTDLKAALATFAGLLGITIALQVEMLLQNRRSTGKLTDNQRFTSRVEAIPWLPDVLDQTLDALHVVERAHKSTMAPSLARETFEACLGRLKTLQRGHFETPYDDIILLYSLLEETSESLLATSVSNDDLQWWMSSHGQTYWRLHEVALQRGVSITRIFIYDIWTEDHEKLAAIQQSGGVNTLRVNRNALPAALRLDMIIWDGRSGYESRLNSTGEAIANHYTLSRSE